MDVALVIRERLEELGLEQRDLARAAHVTESYVSQLLSGKKAPPAPHRTAIYERLDRVLKLPPGELTKVAERERIEELKRKLGGRPEPLFPRVRQLILRTCRPEQATQLNAIIERQPFGELERLVASKLLDVVGIATDIFHLSAKQVALLESRVESWDIDLATFALEIVLRPRVGTERTRRFEIVERSAAPEPGLAKFLADESLSGTATDAELEYLKALQFQGRRPTALFYYRELQNLRDSLHFES
ncbi:MAG TPA: helix-turn-helix transcriptional regulator [Gemmatimonadales bacterium]|jgi:transcriptional regulator with XRE-family HTH domain